MATRPPLVLYEAQRSLQELPQKLMLCEQLLEPQQNGPALMGLALMGLALVAMALMGLALVAMALMGLALTEMKQL